jgi:hypothetical protein
MANISASMKDWSTTPASNQPDSGDAATLQADLQQLQATVRGAIGERSSIVSAATVDLGSVNSGTVNVTGNTGPITSFGTCSAGIMKRVTFASTPTITYSGTAMILPGGASITAAAGDSLVAESLGSGNWKIHSYTKASGAAITGGLTLGTEQASTSGTAITFSSIPAGTKMIKVMFVGVSVDGGNELLLQIGDSGGVENSGYLSSASQTSSAVAASNQTTGFALTHGLGAANVLHGVITLTLEDSANFTWCLAGVLGASNTAATFQSAGSKSLSAELDRVSITCASNFDAGAINILYS